MIPLLPIQNGINSVARLHSEFRQHVRGMSFKVIPFVPDQHPPTMILSHDGALAAERRGRFNGHLQEQQTLICAV